MEKWQKTKALSGTEIMIVNEIGNVTEPRIRIVGIRPFTDRNMDD